MLDEEEELGGTTTETLSHRNGTRRNARGCSSLRGLPALNGVCGQSDQRCLQDEELKQASMSFCGCVAVPFLLIEHQQDGASDERGCCQKSSRTQQEGTGLPRVRP